MEGFAVGAGEFTELGEVADGNVFYRGALVEAGADFDEIGLGVGIGERPETGRGQCVAVELDQDRARALFALSDG